jgi:hypothetical protein
MPIVNGSYVTPSWVNGTSPAIEAAELTDLGNAVVQNQTAISENTTAIGNNTTAIGANSTLIGANTAAIGNLKGMTKIYTNLTVAVSAWGASSTFSGFGYRAVLSCTGVSASYAAMVTFGPTEATNGNYAPIATTGVNSVTIYAAAIPSGAIVIPTVTAWAMVS